MKDKEEGRYMTHNDILSKLDNLELERVRVFRANIEKCVRVKIEAEIKWKKLGDPRNDEMMSEIYPAG